MERELKFERYLEHWLTQLERRKAQEERSSGARSVHRHTGVCFVFVFSSMQRMLPQLCMTVTSLNFYQKMLLQIPQKVVYASTMSLPAPQPTQQHPFPV